MFLIPETSLGYQNLFHDLLQCIIDALLITSINMALARANVGHKGRQTCGVTKGGKAPDSLRSRAFQNPLSCLASLFMPWLGDSCQKSKFHGRPLSFSQKYIRLFLPSTSLIGVRQIISIGLSVFIKVIAGSGTNGSVFEPHVNMIVRARYSDSHDIVRCFTSR